MPKFVEQILSAPWMPLVARIIFTFFFWISGVSHLLNWGPYVEGLGRMGFNPPELFNAAVVAVNLIGAGLIIHDGRYAWLGAGMLAVFTLLTIFLVHNFWTMEMPQRMGSMLTAREHTTVIGALMLYSVYKYRIEKLQPSG